MSISLSSHGLHCQFFQVLSFNVESNAASFKSPFSGGGRILFDSIVINAVFLRLRVS